MGKRIVSRGRSTQRPSLREQPYDIRRDGVTQSLLANYMHCRQGCAYYLDGWRSSGQREALAFGTLFHNLLERLYKGIARGQIEDSTDALELFEKYIRLWLNRESRKAKAMAVPNAHTMAAKARAVFPEYCDFWKSDFDPKLWVEVEGVFDVQWRGVRLRGKRDGKQRLKRYERLVESKTMSQVRGELEDVLSFDPQNLFYLTSLESEEGQARVKHVLYNMIRRPGLKISKKGESLRAYRERITAHIRKDKDHYFKRMELIYTKKEITRFQEEFEYQLAELREWSRDYHRPLSDQKFVTFRSGKACLGRGACSYIDACSQGEMSDYTRNGVLFEELES